MDKPVHLIIRLPYDRPPNAPKEPTPVEWTPQKEQFLWEVLSQSRGPDRTGIDWPELAQYLNIPLPYLLYRAQLRYEEDLRGLQNIQGTLALQLGPAEPVTPSRPVSTPSFGSGSIMPRLNTGLAPSGRTSAVPTPTRLATPASAGPSRTAPWRDSLLTKPPPSRPALTSESTSTLTHRPSATPVTANKSRPLPQVAQSPEPATSSSESSGEEEEEAERARQDQEAVGKRLQDLAKLMSSELLGFARQPRQETPALNTRPSPSSLARTPLPEQQSISAFVKGKGRETASESSRQSGSATTVLRGRDLAQSMKPPTLSTSRLPPSRQSYRTESQQPSSASSAASDTRSPVGSIPSITSPANSQSPYRSSSAAASNSPGGTNPSPSVSSSPARQREIPRSTVEERLKRLSLDGTTTGTGSAPATRPGPILLRKGGKVRHGSSAQGSTQSSFSDMSGD